MKVRRMITIVWIMIGIVLLVLIGIANRPEYVDMQKNIGTVVKIYSVTTLVLCILSGIWIFGHKFIHSNRR